MEQEEKVSRFEEKFRELASASNIEHVDDALKLADVSNVYFESDELHGVEEVVKELVENKPFLLKKKVTTRIGRPAGRGYDDNIGPVGQLIKTAIDLARNWDSTKSVWENVWGAIKRSAADSVNSVISGINKMIETINSLPGVNIPVIAKVDWGSEGGAPGSVASKVHAPSMSTNVNGPHALGNHAGLGDVRGTTYRKLHDGEAVLTRMENANYKRIKQGDMGAVASAMNSSVGFNADGATVARTQAAPQLNFAGANFVVREEADVDKIVENIVSRLAVY